MTRQILKIINKIALFFIYLAGKQSNGVSLDEIQDAKETRRKAKNDPDTRDRVRDHFD